MNNTQVNNSLLTNVNKFIQKKHNIFERNNILRSVKYEIENISLSNIPEVNKNKKVERYIKTMIMRVETSVANAASTPVSKRLRYLFSQREQEGAIPTSLLEASNILYMLEEVLNNSEMYEY